MSNELRNVIISFGAIALSLSLARGHYQGIAHAQDLDGASAAIEEYQAKLGKQSQAIRLLIEEKNELSQELTRLSARSADGDDRSRASSAPVIAAPQPVAIAPAPMPIRVISQPRLQKTRRTSAS